MYWNSHCHLSSLETFQELQGYLEEQKKLQIEGFGVSSFNPKDWERELKQMKLFSQFHWAPCLGLHPQWLSQVSEKERIAAFENLTQWADSISAIGEIGLDLRDSLKSHLDLQKRYFQLQLEFSKEVQKPLVLHIVRAHNEALSLLKSSGPFIQKGFIHGFRGNLEIAYGYLDLGFSLSVGSALLHAQSVGLRSIVSKIPKECLLIETDEGIKNHFNKLDVQTSYFLPDSIALWKIAETVGELRGESKEDVLMQSSLNFCRLMGISSEASYR